MCITTTTTTIFYFVPRRVTINKCMQEETFTIKKEHSHLEIAKANRAKWLGQAEKNIAIKVTQYKKKRDTISIHTHTHTHTHRQRTKKEKCMYTQKRKIKFINVTS
ncbi:hypothetical protein ACROYT_G037565 [Oculina patagonica]